MRISRISEVSARPRHVAVGEFDGVHLGHRAVIAGVDTVLTFDPHPLSVVRPQAAPKLLTSLELKCELIESLRVTELIVIPFDQTFAHQSPEQFIEDVLLSRLGATDVSVGENFRFGYRACGDAALLAGDPRLRTRVVPLVHRDGGRVSSTRIRALVERGEVAAAARLLGGPLRIRGEVVRGEKRGRKLGFPTANLVPDPTLACPANGVYACRVDAHAAAVSIGVRPTFTDDQGLLIEAFLLDFDGDLYGETLTLEFVARLRPEERFESVDALIAQMRRDVECARKLLASTAA